MDNFCSSCGIVLVMTIKHSIASKARWNKLTPEEKYDRMSKAGKARWVGKTKEERREYALKMVKARKK